jgi:hypothetical protein
MPDLLNITFGFVPNEKEVEAINAAFDGSIDWVRYAPNCWFVWDDKGSKVVADKILGLVADKTFFVTKVYKNENWGALPHEIWAWLEKTTGLKRINP